MKPLQQKYSNSLPKASEYILELLSQPSYLGRIKHTDVLLLEVSLLAEILASLLSIWDRVHADE